MKTPILAILLAATALSGCQTVLTPRTCERALSGLQTAQEIVAVLQARGIEPERAARIAEALLLSEITLSAACANVGPPPVASPGA